MPRFKIGDRVKYSDDEHLLLEIGIPSDFAGKTTIIRGITDSSGCYITSDHFYIPESLLMLAEPYDFINIFRRGE